MALYLVEREFAEAFAPDRETEAGIKAYELSNEIRWLTSFLSADKKKTYCLYEVDDVEALRRHAADLGLPADSIVEVTELRR